MSVLMTLRVAGDGSKLEELAAENPSLMEGIAQRGKDAGAIAHQFYAREGEVLVVDEWPDEASFQSFFEANTEIPGLMARAGVTSAPEISFWRKLDTKDGF